VSDRRLPDYDEDLDLHEQRNDTEATSFLPEMNDELPDLPAAHDGPPMPTDPPPMPADPMERPHTREHFALATMPDMGDETPRPASVNERIRRPAPRRKRPTLLPKSLLRQPSNPTNDSVMQPIHGRKDLARPDLSAGRREASDVVKTFDSHELGANPAPLTSANPAALRKPQHRELVRKSTAARRPPPPQRPVRTAPPASPSLAHLSTTLPLSAESLSMTIADQRRRLHVLDSFARGLEICAGILGTLSLAVLIAAMVSILIGNDVSVLNASSALVGSGAALGLTLLMVVAAVSLRQLAHLSAQVAALLEALANRR
jgi:hypothetical protein